MNQRGDNFGSPAQCSISIDVSVIRNMQKDPEYAEHVIGVIKDTQEYYGSFINMVRQSGFSYLCRNINDVNGKLELSVTGSRHPFSTEEEVKEIWKKGSGSDHATKIYEQMKNELLDHYLEMLQKSNAKKSILEVC